MRALQLAAPEPACAFVVFAQRQDARLEIDALKQQAGRFFSVKIGITVDKQYADEPPIVDAARMVIASDDGTSSGTRLCYARPVEESDISLAFEAERAMGTYGLALLAQRCAIVWSVVPEVDDDKAALTIAAIFASLMLGPILSPGGREIYGVRGARLKLEGRPSPYR